jgi:hypothetical protein
MSAINGDKSRFNRERKQKLARRKRNREMLQRAATQRAAANTRTDSKPRSVPA